MEFELLLTASTLSARTNTNNIIIVVSIVMVICKICNKMFLHECDRKLVMCLRVGNLFILGCSIAMNGARNMKNRQIDIRFEEELHNSTVL